MAPAVEMLFQGLRADDRFVQAEAARLLGELRLPEAAPPLVEFVSRFGWHTKLVGFHALANLGDRSVCPALRPLVDAPACFNDWYWYGCKSVRAAAAVALLALGDEGGAPYLRELADKDDDVFFAWFAPTILRLDDSPPAAAELKARLTVETILRPDSRKLRQGEPGALTMVAEALGLLQGPAACEKLRGLLRHRSRYVRGQAAGSLLKASSAPQDVAAVAELADADPTDFVRIKAHEALACAGRDDAGAKIAELANLAADWFDRAVAVEALRGLGLTQYASLVRVLLTRPDPYLRRCAIEALERLDLEGSRSAVAACLDDGDALVVLQAAKFLVALDRKGGTAT